MGSPMKPCGVCASERNCFKVGTRSQTISPLSVLGRSPAYGQRMAGVHTFLLYAGTSQAFSSLFKRNREFDIKSGACSRNTWLEVYKELISFDMVFFAVFSFTDCYSVTFYWPSCLCKKEHAFFKGNGSPKIMLFLRTTVCTQQLALAVLQQHKQFSCGVHRPAQLQI